MKKQLAGWLSGLKYGAPSKKLKIIVVAGADGGYSTCVYLSEILKSSGSKVGLLTANSAEVAGKQLSGSEQGNPINEAGRLQSILALMRKARCEYVVLELPPNVPDHFFAGVKVSMLVVRRGADSYSDQAYKMAGISTLQKLIQTNSPTLVLNRDDESFNDLESTVQGQALISFGTHIKSDCQIRGVKMHPRGSEVELRFDHQTNLILSGDFAGKQSTYNVAAAAAAAYLLHIPVGQIEETISVKSRIGANFEYLPIERPYDIVLDGSMTPDGLAETLDSIKHFTKNRVIALIGGRVDQPKSWRPLIGELVAKAADRLVVTDGDHGVDETAGDVRASIMEGVLTASGEAMTDEIDDRMNAIEKAMSIARRGDTVVICSVLGRAYRQLGDQRLSWDDRKKIFEILEG